jgi:hypothetical protein
MSVLGRLGGGHGPDRTIAANASAAARLLRAYAVHSVSLTNRCVARPDENVMAAADRVGK